MNLAAESDVSIDSREKSRNDHYYSRLRAFDKHYLEKSSLVYIINIVTSILNIINY